VTSGILHALSAKSFNDYDRKLTSLDCGMGVYPPGCSEGDPRLPNLRRARREQAVAMGGYVVGGLLIATGATLLYLNQPRSIERRRFNSLAKSFGCGSFASGSTGAVSIT
jgi:hypothetical protein